MAPHSSILAWRIPWTEEPGRLQSTGSLRVGHDWVTSLFTFLIQYDLIVTDYICKDPFPNKITSWGSRCTWNIKGHYQSFYCCCCSVTQLCLRLHGLQHTRLPCPSPSPGVCSNSCPLRRVKPSNHLTIDGVIYKAPSSAHRDRFSWLKDKLTPSRWWELFLDPWKFPKWCLASLLPLISLWDAQQGSLSSPAYLLPSYRGQWERC